MIKFEAYQHAVIQAEVSSAEQSRAVVIDLYFVTKITNTTCKRMVHTFKRMVSELICKWCLKVWHQKVLKKSAAGPINGES